EKLVRERAERLPTTIFRPSIVVGERDSGWTPAFNVVYGAAARLLPRVADGSARPSLGARGRRARGLRGRRHRRAVAAARRPWPHLRPGRRTRGENDRRPDRHVGRRLRPPPYSRTASPGVPAAGSPAARPP